MSWSDERYRQDLIAAVGGRIERMPHPLYEEGLPLDDHQQEAMREIWMALSERRLRAFSIVHSCGTGKTVLAENLVSASQEVKGQIGEEDRRDVVLVPERAVLSSVAGEFYNCLNPGDIGIWGMGKRSLDRPVVLSTIQALQMNAQKLPTLLPLDRTDLVIGDEADTYLTEPRRKVVEQFRNALRAGFTATPVWPNGRDIEELWGPKIHHLPLDEAILRGINTPPFYKLYETRIGEEDLHLSGGDYDEKELSAALRSVEIHRAIPALYRTVVPSDDRDRFPTMVFVPSTALVEAVSHTLQEELGAEGVSVKGWVGAKVSDREVERDIEAFQGGSLHILVLCEMAGRGLDLPMARVLIDAYPTLSRTKLEHRCGRVLRKMRDGSKPFSIVIQIHPHANRFKPLTLPDLLGERAWEDARRGRPLLMGEAENPGAPVLAEVEALRRRIEGSNPPYMLTLVRELDVYQHLQERAGYASWDERFAELTEFHTKHERWPSRYSTDEAEHSLGSWLSNQRIALREGKLTEEQEERLGEIGVEASGKREEKPKSWDERFAELTTFRTEHPERWPSRSSTDEAEHSLGSWLSNQRIALREGRLTEEQEERLGEIGVEASGKREEKPKSWDERFAELTEFHTKHERRPGQHSTDEAERSLGEWLRSQRIALREGRLTEEQEERLGEIGVEAAGKMEEKPKSWDERFAELTEFHTKHERRPSRRSTDEAERSLGSWLSNQRIALREGKLTEEQEERLGEIGVEAARKR